MNLVKCENGHFYDEERYPSCPHCVAPALRNDGLTMPVMHTPASDAVTVALEQQPDPVTEAKSQQTSSLQDAVKAASAGAGASVSGADDEKTVGFFSSTIGTEPVVGWLVCTAGGHFGEDFKLKSGRNFIGRALGMDVPVTKDSTVSRERHAIVVYEPRGNVFLVQPGDSKELCYLNDEVVLAPKELKVNDKLTVGKTELMFIPCCSPVFNWDMVKQEQ
jgi:hypothetical protein